jgi:Smg protein
MKENVLDILMYLFENYLYGTLEETPDQESLRVELMQAGFRSGEIDKAFAWLEGLSTMRENAGMAVVTNRAIRLYTVQECKKLDAECRGFLLRLERMGVLDSSGRELVIDRVMALGADEIDLMELKWVILMVLFNQPGQEAAYAWMEDMVFDDMAGSQH